MILSIDFLLKISQFFQYETDDESQEDVKTISTKTKNTPNIPSEFAYYFIFLQILYHTQQSRALDIHCDAPLPHQC